MWMVPEPSTDLALNRERACFDYELIELASCVGKSGRRLRRSLR
jgi:hypothetical protein